MTMQAVSRRRQYEGRFGGATHKRHLAVAFCLMVRTGFPLARE